MKTQNVVGLCVGRITVLSILPKQKNNSPLRILGKCECGTVKSFIFSNLKKGGTQSCGCLNKKIVGELFTTHGFSQDPTVKSLYGSWVSMKSRCVNPNHKHWKHYGGRGIKVCARWINDFVAFMQDMGGFRPLKMSLDRIDVNGNYEPGNCRWVNQTTQMNNRVNTKYFEINGVKMTLTEAARILNIGKLTATHKRLTLWVERLGSAQLAFDLIPKYPNTDLRTVRRLLNI